MDKQTWIGFLLIAVIIVGFSMLNRPSEEEMAARQHYQDSVAIAQQMEIEAALLSEQLSEQLTITDDSISADSLSVQLQATYGAFASVAKGTNEHILMENTRIRLTFDTKGGRISRVDLKDYHAYGDSVLPLTLFRGEESNMSMTLITANNRVITTDHLYFTPLPQNDTTLILRLQTNIEDSYLDFVYTLSKDDYMVSYSIQPHHMQAVLAQNINSLEMQWSQRIPQQEKGRKFEEKYAQLQYMLVGGDMEKLSEQKYDSQRENSRIRWIGYKDQFFSTVMIADDAFTSSEMESKPLEANSGYIKEYRTKTSFNFDLTGREISSFLYYFGPNHYNTLKSYDDQRDGDQQLHLQELVPLGWKIVSWINKILVIPMFDLFTSWNLHIGVIILLMTLVIKLIILPFVFASYRSSAKMRALKPQLDAINEKYPMEKMQERQQATMALYSRAGVSPMSGCLPMLFQFPVLMAMFWFFPTAIELRGQSLFWADDLSTYDAIITWNSPIPFFGTHLSLFCLLMTICNIGYTYITMQSQSTGNEMKFMKYFMYLMPVMFLFIFNDYAAGLSYYYLLSLFFTIMQTMIFRWSIDEKKLLAEMEANAKKKDSQPKKSGFMARLEAMQREQQRLAKERAKEQARR